MSLPIPLFSASHATRIIQNHDDDSHSHDPGHEFARVWQELEELRRGGKPTKTTAHSKTLRFSASIADTESIIDDNAPRSPNSDMPANGSSASVSPPTQPKTYPWITLWFSVTFFVVLWDVGYCFMRPRSMLGGDLHWIWMPYRIYQEVDLIYGVRTYQEGGGFTNAQSLLNVIETFLNAYYLYAAHVQQWAPATLVGFTSASLTLAKTVLYWVQEYYCSYCAVGHNTVKDLILFWIIPNGLWIVFPSLIVYTLGRDLIGVLEWADKERVKGSKRE